MRWLSGIRILRVKLDFLEILSQRQSAETVAHQVTVLAGVAIPYTCLNSFALGRCGEVDTSLDGHPFVQSTLDTESHVY